MLQNKILFDEWLREAVEYCLSMTVHLICAWINLVALLMRPEYMDKSGHSRSLSSSGSFCNEKFGRP